MASSKDIASIIAERFIAELNKGVAPWQKGFVSIAPQNAVSHREYRGINYFLLSMLGVDYACTFKQAKELGGSVKKGAKGIPVIFWRFVDKKPQAGAAPTDKPEKIPFMRYYTVFAMADVEGAQWSAPNVHPGASNKRIDNAEELFAKVREVCQFNVRDGGNQPCFIPALNAIEMPQFARWAQPSRFYKTLFHECGHALGKVTKKEFNTRFGSEDYSTEELVAELFAAVCVNMLGINDASCWDNSVAYIQGWASKLGSDPQAIISAAQEAQKRLDLIFPRPVEAEETSEE